MPVMRTLKPSELIALTRTTNGSNGKRAATESEYDVAIATMEFNVTLAMDLDPATDKVLTVKNRFAAAQERWNEDEKNRDNQIMIVTSTRRGQENVLFVTKYHKGEEPVNNRGRKKQTVDAAVDAETPVAEESKPKRNRNRRAA